MNSIQLNIYARLRISSDDSHDNENDYFFIYGTYGGFPSSK